MSGEKSQRHTLKRKIPHRQFAERYGVDPKTIDRWVDAEILDAPERINKRKYHDEDSRPRRDSERAA